MSAYEQKYMGWWVLGVLVVITLIIFGWWWRGSQNATGVAYGVVATSTALVSPTSPTPLIVAQNSRQGESVASIAESLPDATRFAQMLISTGVGASLNGKGPYTIFVPTDRAFGQLPKGSINDPTPAQLKRLVQYHIVSSRAIDVNAVAAGTIQALSKDMLNFSVNQGDQSARVNSGVVLEAYSAKNGTVYLINTVLLPPTVTNP